MGKGQPLRAVGLGGGPRTTKKSRRIKATYNTKNPINFNVDLDQNIMRIWMTLLLLQFSGYPFFPTPSQAEEKTMPAPVAILYHEIFSKHETPKGHPERPQRLAAVLDKIKALPNAKHLSWPKVTPAPISRIEEVHDPKYVKLAKEFIQNAKEKKEIKVLPTGDAYVGPHTWEAALHAAGAAMGACDEVMSGRATSSFALVRPPGHHATRTKGMGFCIFGNVSVAARYLQDKHKLKRILICDFDVHHGNGTQDIFYQDPSVFYFSAHQQGIYPHSGAANETGAGKGKGFTLNVEMKPGAGDDQAKAALEQHLVPAMDTFKPEFVIVSAGFDAHKDDPLGDLAYTKEGYFQLAKILIGIADKHAKGRIVFVLEGGYNLTGLSESVAGIVDTLQRRGKD